MVEVKKLTDNASLITFSYSAPAGHKVFLAGIFNDWNPDANPMMFFPDEQIYKCSVKLQRGEYEYKFVTDGLWVLDETNPNFVSNDFGTLNSIVILK